MIPKLMHFIYLDCSDMDDLREKYPLAPMTMTSFKLNNPDWKIIFWNYSKFQKSKLPFAHLVELLYENGQHVKAGDILRVITILVAGGVYSDLDVYWYKAIPEEWREYSFLCNLEPSSRNRRTGKIHRTHAGNALLGGMKGNRYALALLKHIGEIPMDKLLYEQPNKITGPSAVRDMLAEFEELLDVLQVDPIAFNPFVWTESETMAEYSYDELGEMFPDSMAIHLYANSWGGREAFGKKKTEKILESIDFAGELL